MRVPKRLTMALAAGALVISSVAALTLLFVMRFQSGDVYPCYSTLRADPLGARVFYESVHEAGLAAVSRNTRDLRTVDLSPRTTLFFLGDRYPLGADAEEMPKDLANQLFGFVDKGGRMVITLRPLFADERSKDAAETNRAPDAVVVSESEEAEGPEGPPDAGEDAAEELGVDESEEEGIAVTAWLGTEALARADVKPPSTALLTPRYFDSGLPTNITSHTSVCFTNINADWDVVYESEGEPVILERAIGEGSIVLSALSYFVSNEALRDECHPRLLAWLVGSRSKEAVFDEVHLGITEDPGVASLMRRYHLFGVVAAGLLVALLFIWQNAIPLVPALDEASLEVAAVSADRDSAAGYVNLLRRSIPRGSILAICVSKWQESAAGTALADTALRGDVDELLAPSEQARGKRKDLPATYNAIAQRVKAHRLGIEELSS